MFIFKKKQFKVPKVFVQKFETKIKQNCNLIKLNQFIIIKHQFFSLIGFLLIHATLIINILFIKTNSIKEEFP